jgi:4-hydroxy-tetrahydrodipicolinate reductase
VIGIGHHGPERVFSDVRNAFKEILLRIGLFGFGRTGRVVAEEIIKDTECTLGWVVRNSSQNNHEFASDFLGYPHKREGKFFCKEEVSAGGFFSEHFVDTIIDFSSPEAIYEYRAAAHVGTHIVSAVSRYGDAELELFRELSRKTAIIHSANITLGVNFLLVASKLLSQVIPHADIEIIEEHFKAKECPSGTALKIAEKLGLDPVKHVNSIRVGGIIGKHEVVFGLPFQTIRLTHESISRSAFGTGALYAAKRIRNAENGIYTMEGLMRDSILEKIAVDDLLS